MPQRALPAASCRSCRTLAVMERLLTPQLVLAARSQLRQLSLDVENNMFRSTWLASHVRLVELVPNSNASLSLLVAHVLTRSPRFDYTLEQWLPNSQFEPVSSEAVAALVKHALADMEQEDRWPNDALAAFLARLGTASIDFAYEITADPNGQRPCAPYQYGPTSQMVWGRGDRIYFLQVHNES